MSIGRKFKDIETCAYEAGNQLINAASIATEHKEKFDKGEFKDLEERIAKAVAATTEIAEIANLAREAYLKREGLV